MTDDQQQRDAAIARAEAAEAKLAEAEKRIAYHAQLDRGTRHDLGIAMTAWRTRCDAAEAKLAALAEALRSIHEDGPRFLFAVPIDPVRFMNEMARCKGIARHALAGNTTDAPPSGNGNGTEAGA